MDLNHLHLHVRELERSQRFYGSYFDFREQAHHEDILFLTNTQSFNLALAPADRVEPLPGWFHFGFRLHTPDAVRGLHARMTADGVPLKPLHDAPDFVTFRCADPDGYSIEVYWE